MSITHVATNFGTPTAALSSTSVVTKPAGLAIGDVMIAVVNANQAGITSPGVHWTRLISQDAAVDLYRCEVWYCVATSTETAATNFTFSDGDSNSPMWAAIAAYRGVNQTSPINASSVNSATTTNPQTGPNITTTATSLVLNIRTTRNSSSTSTFSSSVTNERFDGHNAGTGAVAYNGALYDSGSEQAAGSISGVSITRSGGTQTDTISVTLALATANVSVTPGAAAVTVTANAPVAAAGQSATAGVATVTVSTKAPQVLSGKVVNTVGVATVTAACPDVGRRIPAGVAAAVAAGGRPNMFFGTPAYRTLIVPADTWQNSYGIAQRVIDVKAE